jgi:hypothetical protein
MARRGSVRYNPYGRHTRTRSPSSRSPRHTHVSTRDPHTYPTRRRSHRRTLDPAWTEEYKARIADPSWEQRKALYYRLHKYRCRGCRRRHNLNLHHKSYGRMVKKIGPGTYKRIWAELDRDFAYACPRCHKRIHTYQHHLLPGTHFGLRTITNIYLNTRLFFHYVGYPLLFALMLAAVSTGLAAYFSPTTLQRVIACVEIRVEYVPPTIPQTAACRGQVVARP